MKQTKREKIDELLKDAARQSLDDIINDYPSLEDLEGNYEFSNRYNKKMERLFRKAKKIEAYDDADVWHKFRRISLNTAAVLCMLFTVLSLVAFTVPEIRVAITNYIVEQNDDHKVISIGANEYNGQVIKGAPKYLPDGYKINAYTKAETITDILYENDMGGFIYYTRIVGDTMFTMDDEDNIFEDIAIGEHTGYITDKNGELTLIFNDGEYTYYLTSGISRTEVIKIAQSILK